MVYTYIYMVYTWYILMRDGELVYEWYIYNIYMVYTWYIHGILHVYAVLTDMSGIYLVNTSWVCSLPFFIMIYLWYTMYIFEIYIVYQRYIIIKKGTEQTDEVLTRYIPDISVRTAYTCNIPCIYHVYTFHIPALFWYTCYIQCIFHVYTLYIILGKYHVYTMYIHGIHHVYT